MRETKFLGSLSKLATSLSTGGDLLVKGGDLVAAHVSSGEPENSLEIARRKGPTRSEIIFTFLCLVSCFHHHADLTTHTSLNQPNKPAVNWPSPVDPQFQGPGPQVSQTPS